MRIVILGGGQAAASMAAKLRALGHDGALTVIGAEPVAPYQRPPLSKAYLLGQMALDRLLLRGPEWWEGNGITLLTGTAATAIDRAARVVQTTSGPVPYDALALCLGASPRRLPEAVGGHLPGVFCVRDLADVDALAAEMRPDRRLTVIGGGYIGLEAAAVARKLGLAVTVIESGPRILGRVASEPMAALIRDLHAAHGVEIVEGVSVERITGTARADGVALTDGRVIAADLVVTGIGVAPETALAAAAGLAIDNGIAVDTHGRSDDPAIWAAGDCASFPAPEDRFGARMRLESVGNAIDMGEAVAENILGAAKAYAPKPWFWSDQFDAKLQMAGLAIGADRFVTRREGEGVSIWAYAGARLICVEALNDARAYMAGKRLIESGRSPAPEAVADPAVTVKTLMAAP